MILEESKTQKDWPQILAIFIGGFAGFNSGLLFSWPSPFLVKITQDKKNYDVTEEEGVNFNIIYPILLMISCPFFAKLIDIIGRKRTLLLIVIPQLLSWLLSGLAKSAYLFYAARIFAGIADGCLFTALPAYIGEIANPKVRDAWGNVFSTSMLMGDFLINVIGSYCGVRLTSCICLPLPILFLILFRLMPESPYFDIIKDNENNAKKSIKFLNRINNIEEIYSQLKSDVDRQISESGTWFDIIKIKSNRKGLFAGLFLRFSQQLSGFGVFFTFTQFIFQKSGGTLSYEVSSIVYVAIILILNVLASIFVVSRFGRLICYITSSGFCAITMFLVGIYFFLDENLNLDVSTFNWIPLTGLILYQVFASYGLSVIPTLMLSELFSASVKSKAVTILVMAYGLAHFLANFIFYRLYINFGFFSPFIFFGFCCAISSALSYFIVPETRGKSLEEIQQTFKGNIIN